MVVGRPPFKQAEKGDRFWRILEKGDYQLFWKYHLKMGSTLLPKTELPEFKIVKELIERMLHPDPEKRPTIPEIKAHIASLRPPSTEKVKGMLRERINAVEE